MRTAHCFLAAEAPVPNGGIEASEGDETQSFDQQKRSFLEHVERGAPQNLHTGSLDERLHALITGSVQEESLVSKIKGMLFKEMKGPELLKLIKNNSALQSKITHMRAALESLKFRELAASGSWLLCARACECACDADHLSSSMNV